MHPGPGVKGGRWRLGLKGGDVGGSEEDSSPLCYMDGSGMMYFFPVESPMNHPIANICHLYITYSPCQLGDYIYYRSHLLREASETAIEFVVVKKKHSFIGKCLGALGTTKVVLRGSWACHCCKTDRGPP